MLKVLAAAFVSSAVLSACAATDERPPPIVDAGFKTYVLKSTKHDRELHFRYQVRRSGENMRVCGAWAPKKMSPKDRLVVALLEEGNVYIGNERLLRNLRHFKRRVSPARLDGQPSSCRAARVPWTDTMKGLDPTIAFPDRFWY